ncbi:hypothetical protein B0I37DRAFT_393573 [Chaetomium sp. MPI-CAGE-AT-0009]|nr:hypothetical protein B0I37DRAFT_393573 [Chaetomium sp. MPI-CAGE-AT-0009]
MPTKLHPKQALHLDGIQFAPGHPFSSRYAGSEGKKQLAQVRERASGILSQIFDLCVARTATFAALEDWTLGWQIVAGDMAETYGCVMEAGEVEELVTVFADARARFLDSPRADSAHSSSDRLPNLIDRWLDATRRNAGAPSSHPPPPPPSLPSRPAPLENLLAGFSLLNHGTSPPAAAASSGWPPSHLPPADCDLLDHFKVREHLAGVCWDAKGTMPNLPGDNSDPLALRLFLGWLAAAHTPPPPNDSPFALFAAPVAFLDNKERQAWFRPLGNQSKLFGHVEGFLEYTAAAFHAGKKMALGLLTPLRRFGTALMIRLIERDGAQGLQVVFFCPWDEHPWIKEAWKLQDWRLRLWKSTIIDKIDAWAAKHQVGIHEGYSGGSIRVRKVQDHDSVGMCAGWLMRVVTATQKTIPGDAEEDEWEWENTCYFKKLENWVKVEESAGDQMMDIDEDML